MHPIKDIALASIALLILSALLIVAQAACQIGCTCGDPNCNCGDTGQCKTPVPDEESPASETGDDYGWEPYDGETGDDQTEEIGDDYGWEPTPGEPDLRKNPNLDLYPGGFYWIGDKPGGSRLGSPIPRDNPAYYDPNLRLFPESGTWWVGDLPGGDPRAANPKVSYSELMGEDRKGREYGSGIVYQLFNAFREQCKIVLGTRYSSQKGH